MTSNRLRRVGAFAVLPAAMLLASGCAAIQTAPTGTPVNEQSQFWYDPADGASAETGDLGLRNVIVVAGDDGEATVLAAIANGGDVADRLDGASIAGSPGEFSDGPIDLLPGTTTQVGYPAETSILLSGVEDVVVPGLRVDVTFEFASAPEATVSTIVQQADEEYLPAAPPGSELVVDEPEPVLGEEEGPEPVLGEEEGAEPVLGEEEGEEEDAEIEE